MRGRRNPQSTMLAFVNLDERVPQDHPLRIIKGVADDVLDRMSGDFDKMYSKIGRSSVQPHYRCCALRRLPSRRNLPAPNLTLQASLTETPSRTPAKNCLLSMHRPTTRQPIAAAEIAINGGVRKSVRHGGEGRLELPRLAAHDPKSCSSTNSDTSPYACPAGAIIVRASFMCRIPAM